MAETHLNINISQKALIVIEGKLLLGLESGGWELPGGRVNEGEMDLDEALKREIKEEYSIDINPLSIYSSYLFKKDTGEIILMLVYKCELIGSIDEIKLQQEEVYEFKLFSRDELKDLKNIYGNSVRAIEKYLSH